MSKLFLWVILVLNMAMVFVNLFFFVLTGLWMSLLVGVANAVVAWMLGKILREQG